VCVKGAVSVDDVECVDGAVCVDDAMCADGVVCVEIAVHVGGAQGMFGRSVLGGGVPSTRSDL